MVKVSMLCGISHNLNCIFTCIFMYMLLGSESAHSEKPGDEGCNNGITLGNEKSSDKDATEILRVPVYGNLHKFAYYYTFVNIGNHPQKQMAIIDTGSQLVNFACRNCSYCGNHVLKNLDPKSSYTASYITCKSVQCKIVGGKCNPDNSCGFMQTYSEGSSVHGKYISDVINFDSAGNERKLISWYNYIGCVNRENDLIYSQVSNGILGLSKIKNSENASNDQENHDIPAFIEKFLNDHYEEENAIFALCLSENGGILTIGGYDKSYNIDKLKHQQKGRGLINRTKWIPLINSDLYVVKMIRLEFMGDSIKIKNRKFVLDSGTTISILESGLFKKIIGYFQSLCTTIEYVNMNNSLFSRNKNPINWINSAETRVHGFSPKAFPAKINPVVQEIFFNENYKNMNTRNIKNDEKQTKIFKCIQDRNTHNICFSDISNMPSIFLESDTGEKIEWLPRSYFLKRNSKKFSTNPNGWWCLGIEEGNLDENILGATFFKGNHLIFNLHTNKLGKKQTNKILLLGISHGNCPSYV
ncbi:aspartyl acid protease, putative [Theileria equi strain WA]|uniref:Aspartyl acid protease, putative n=1 Tax=Theileria equi strain WA TaxID=1537102 RepID=L1LDN5_THEEQ|nr:aspartyl acid protease, putative [Theileria equi strain WA]EKX73253.1 aspartyl acid protease, putative [Theileria equi strain WA]|eukprot:XP_004832705.1 aspartyl acid protease, putative [Theileria equi strain WA]